MSEKAAGSSSIGPIGSFIGWMFLPGLVTGWIQTFLYRLFTRAGDPIPQPGTYRHVRDRKYIYCFVIAAYLLFTIYECWRNIAKTPTFYNVLGVPVDADDRLIKKQFRRLSVKFHPDKVGANLQHVFLHLKVAFDTLSDPVKRFAYDRIGSSILQSEWMLCKTHYDYVSRGIMTKWPGYIGSLVVLVVLSALGKMEYGKYWRFYFLLCMFIFDYASTTRPYFLVTTKVIKTLTRKTLLPFEQIALAQQILFSIIIAISQLAPLFQKPKFKNDESMYSQQLDRLFSVVKATEVEAKHLTTMELAPFVKEDGSVDRDLHMKMRDWLVERRIESEPEVRDAMGRVIERRKQKVG